MMSEKKVNNLFKLMQLFVEKKSICKNGYILNSQGMLIDKVESLGFNVRTLRRYLDEIKENYPHIVKLSSKNSDCYKMESTSEIFHAFLSNSEEISWLLQLIYESDKNLLNELAQESRKRLDKISKSERDIFLFQGLPFDELADKRKKDIFNMLKLAIKKREYRDIHYHYNCSKILKNAQCIKMLFMESNWYIAIASVEKGFLLLRIAFITHVEYSKKETYQESQLSKYSSYLRNIQNPMTKFGVEKKTAHLLASTEIAKYFKPHMKKFLNSQKFIKEKENGAIEFTLEYTHALEILPLIKRWLPDIEILSPSSLQEKMIEDLNSYLSKIK